LKAEIMEKSQDKINKIASGKVSTWKEEATERRNNNDWTKRSFKIAVRILREIRAQKTLNGMTQRKLAEEMGVSPQYINKVIKGKENLTLETISKIETVLGIKLIEIPSFETSQAIPVNFSESKFALSRTGSISISENVWSYSNDIYSDATGTYG
jgi:transcriptional regulator with XRE-family HTH domain